MKEVTKVVWQLGQGDEVHTTQVAEAIGDGTYYLNARGRLVEAERAGELRRLAERWVPLVGRERIAAA